MKSIRIVVILALAMLVLAVTTGAVLAAQTEEVLPCAGENVSGQIIGVDEENHSVTVLTTEGTLCTVTLGGSYDHPIVSLLGMYFGDLNTESLAAVLGDADTGGCVTFVADEPPVEEPGGEETPAEEPPATGNWVWTDCGQEGAVPVTVIGQDSEGNFIGLTGDGELITLMVEDQETANHIIEELAKLAVNWALDGEGDLVQVSDQIAAYHAEGMGFGVLVKLYALAEATGIPVDELVTEFQSGTGMGDIFKEYGKPAKTGVGHVRNDKEQKGKGPHVITQDDSSPQDNGNGKGKDKNKDKGVCNAKAKGGKAKGRDDAICQTP